VVTRDIGGMGVTNLSFSTPTPVGRMAEIQWNGSADQTITFAKDGLRKRGPTGIDLTESGAIDARRFEVLSTDLGLEGNIEACTDANKRSILTVRSAGVVPSNPVDVVPELSILTSCTTPVGRPEIVSVTRTGSGVSFSNLGTLRLVLNTGVPHTLAVDLVFAGIDTVHTPAIELEEVTGPTAGFDNGAQADGPNDGDAPQSAAGNTVHWTDRVTNIG